VEKVPGFFLESKGVFMKRLIGFQVISRMMYSMRLFCFLLVLVICFFPSVVFSYDISLSWDESPDDVVGYKVFMRIQGQDYNYNVPVYKGDAGSCTITGLNLDVQYYFVARSYREINNESIDSDNSNEISYSRSTPAPVVDSSDNDTVQDSDPVENPVPVTVVDSSDNDTVQDSDPVENPIPEIVADMVDSVEENIQDVITDSEIADDGVMVLKNISSYQPILTSPEKGLTQTTITPTLKTVAYNVSAQNNIHSMTEWQISRDMNFRSMVFQKKSKSSLTELNVPQLILDENATYFWRVRFFDTTNTASEWSDSGKFTTGITTDTKDGDQNGVPDDLEVDEHVDLDFNGISDIQQDDIKSMSTSTGNSQVGVGIESGEGTVDMIQSIDWDLIGDSENRPKKMPMNLIGFRLLVETGAEVEVVIYFSEKLPGNAKWFKHDIQDGWQDISEHTVFTHTKDGRTKVTFTLKDGGFGDEDGVANGVIVDPSGPGFSSLEETVIDAVGTSDNVSSESGSGGGCFIGTGIESQETPAALYILSVFFFLTSVTGLACSRKG
jgi:chitinase